MKSNHFPCKPEICNLITLWTCCNIFCCRYQNLVRRKIRNTHSIYPPYLILIPWHHMSPQFTTQFTAYSTLLLKSLLQRFLTGSSEIWSAVPGRTSRQRDRTISIKCLSLQVMVFLFNLFQIDMHTSLSKIYALYSLYLNAWCMF